MWLVNRATERPVTVLMFFVAVGLFGLVSLSRLDVNLLPDLSYPTLTVRTELDGAAPQEVENLLSKPIEEAVGIVKNVREVRSLSRSGQSDVTIEFAWGTDMNLASVDVREKLDVLELPLEAKRPLLLRFDPASDPIMRFALRRSAATDGNTATLSTADLKELRRLAEDELKPELENVAGVAAVKVSGGLEEEIEILVDQERLAQLDLSIDDVAGRIRAENTNLSGGSLEQGSQRFLVRTINEYQSVDEFRSTIIATREERPVYLGDIATVTRGFKEREAITRVDGIEAVEMALYKEGDGNTVQIATQVERRMQGLRESLPESLEIVTIQDQSGFIRAAIDQVVAAALIGGLLAILVLYGFLRDARATLIIGLAIPVSVIGTFALMYLSGLSLNIMSLGGIALAVGLLVDNSIVVLENIVSKRESGRSVVEAAREGAGEVATAVTAATLTTIAVFFPMVFVTGIAGQLFRDQSLTVTFALLFSLVLALVLIPMLASSGGRKGYAESLDRSPPGRVGRALGRIGGMAGSVIRAAGRLLGLAASPLVLLFGGFGRLAAAAYGRALPWALTHRALVLISAGAIFAGTVALVPRLGTELIPQLSQGEFSVNIRLGPGSPLESTDGALRAAWQAAAATPGVERTYSVAGSGNRLDASPVDSGEHTGSLTVLMQAGTTRDDESLAIGRIRDRIAVLPGLQYDFSRPELLSLSTPLEVVISGFELERLRTASERITDALRANDRFADIRSTVEAGNPEIQIAFDQELAAKLGLSVRDIADEVVSGVKGSLATRYSWRDKKIDVIVRSVDRQSASLDDVGALIVNPASERPVTLDDVATIVLAEGPAEIRRLDQQRAAIVSANLASGDLGSAVAEVDRILAALDIPAGLTTEVVGQSEEMEQSLASMQFTLILAIFLVYLVMASQFESLLHPFIILFTIPLALVGAILALFITGTTINVVAFIGVIMLAGIVVNNAIVLIDLINQLRRDGVATTEAILQAGRNRLRPILMTTLTTALGLLPMALGFGEGAEIRAPMAITVIGGLLTSTLLTLFVIPVAYSLVERERRPRRQSATDATAHAQA